MAFVDENVPTRGGIPDLYGFIVTARGDTFAIWRPRYGIHSVGMTFVGEDVIARVGIPDQYHLIHRSGGDTLSIGRPRHGEHPGAVAGEANFRASRRGVPRLDRNSTSAIGEVR